MNRRDRRTWEQQDRGTPRRPQAPSQWRPEPLRLPLYRPLDPDTHVEREAERPPSVIVIDPDDHPDLA